ncbi:MAG: immunoglobulin domain-containing protein [Bacteroidales bacterium]|nr:immunoglobulin domain-containing protein [Bacteroidales bacterium]
MWIKRGLFFISFVLYLGLMGQVLTDQKTISVQNSTGVEVVYPSVIKYPVYFDISPPLRDLGIDPPKEKGKKVDVKKPPLQPNPNVKEIIEVDPVLQNFLPASKATPQIVVQFAGPNNSSFPPDANGSVGPNHYFQAYNVQYKIYNKQGNTVAGPTNYNTLFSGVTGSSYNDGDPIILYDENAQRWLAAEFSVSGSNDYMLIAVSTSSDPTGTWYRWSFDVDDMPDYMKFGIWRDGYYMAVNNSSGKDVYVFDRSTMLNGGSNPAMVGFDNPYRPSTASGFHCIMPVDNDGTFAPSGTPGLFLTINDNAWGGSDQLWLYALTVNWSNPQSSTFSRIQQINVPAFDAVFGTNWNDITQKGTTQKLDALSEMLMYSVKYRNFGNGDERIVACHAVDVGSQQAGIRWYELKKNQTSGQWEIRQSGTYKPDANSRWNASIAINKNKDIAVAYSIASSNLYPGLRLTGQTASENVNASGVFDVSEYTIADGTTYQASVNRWGDYALMSVDPVDEETFWFSSSYMGVNTSTKKTTIIAFKFPNNTNPTNFTANAVSSSQINLTWNLNSSNNPVLLAYSTTPTFGTPANGTSYSPGQNIPGGGTVIYYGSATSFSHTGLSPNTTYYYKLWSNTGSYNWSTGVTAQATTLTAPINSFPFTWDFENSTDYTTDFTPWTTYDGDGKPTYQSADCNFPNEGSAFAWMCMNPVASGWTASQGDVAHGGSRCGMSICPADGSASNDWFISPPIQLGTNSSFSFWALSPKPGTWGNDEFKVLVSTTNNNPSSFTPISGSNPVQAPSTWTQFTYDLSSYNNQTIYLAIQHVSSGKFMLWIDDLVINSTVGCTAATIATHPTSTSACPGSQVSFTVSANGTPPISYQWKKNGTNINGATNSTFTITSVGSSDVGSYTCVVSNACGNAESNPATLTLSNPPTITTQPTSQSVCQGNNVTFSINASGSSPLQYQWKKDGISIPGATSSTLMLSSVTTADAGTYSCVVSNSCGSTNSSNATLTVYPSTIITSHPANLSINEGSNATFTVVASGTNLTYQWQKDGVNLSNNSHISGANSSTLQIFNVTPADQGYYRCIVNGTCGNATSNSALLLVDPLSIAENSSLPFVIFPNPSNGIFFIHFPNNPVSGYLSIYDPQGKLVLWEHLNEINEKRISLAHLSEGTYLLKLIINNQEYTQTVHVKF